MPVHHTGKIHSAGWSFATNFLTLTVLLKLLPGLTEAMKENAIKVCREGLAKCPQGKNGAVVSLFVFGPANYNFDLRRSRKCEGWNRH